MRPLPGSGAPSVNVGDILSWQKFTAAEADFTAAALSEDIELFQLPAGGIIHAVKIKHSTAFSGGGSTSALMSVGIVGNLEKYASLFDVFQAVADDTFQLSDALGSENHGAATSIRLQLTANVNVSLFTAGAVDLWVLTSQIT